jgi:hypothetical protein
VSVFAVAIILFDEGEEPGEGFVLTGESDGGEQGGAEPGVAGSGEGILQSGEGFGGAGFGDGDGCFGGCVVFQTKEFCCPGDGGGAFEVEDSGVAGSEEFWFTTGEFGAETEEENCGVGADLLDGSRCVDLDGEFFVGEELGEESEEADAVQASALDEGQGAGAAKRTCGVGRASPDWFELDVAHALEEDVLILIFEGGESFGRVVLSPALRVGLGRVIEEAGEGGGEVRGESGEFEVSDDACRLGYEEVIAMLQGFAQASFGKVWGGVTQRFESCGLSFDIGGWSHG